MGCSSRRSSSMGKGSVRLQIQLLRTHLQCKVLLVGVLLAHIQAKQDSDFNIHSYGGGWYLGHCHGSSVKDYILLATSLTSAQTLVTIFQCRPVSGFWTRFATPQPKPGSITCGVNDNHFFDGNSVPNIVTDGLLLVLPVPFIWQLNLPRAQKIGVSSAFLLGAL